MSPKLKTALAIILDALLLALAFYAVCDLIATYRLPQTYLVRQEMHFFKYVRYLLILPFLCVFFAIRTRKCGGGKSTLLALLYAALYTLFLLILNPLLDCLAKNSYLRYSVPEVRRLSYFGFLIDEFSDTGSLYGLLRYPGVFLLLFLGLALFILLRSHARKKHAA